MSRSYTRGGPQTKMGLRHLLQRSMWVCKLRWPKILRSASQINLLNFSRWTLLARYTISIYFPSIEEILTWAWIYWEFEITGSCFGNTRGSNIWEQCYCTLWYDSMRTTHSFTFFMLVLFYIFVYFLFPTVARLNADSSLFGCSPIDHVSCFELLFINHLLRALYYFTLLSWFLCA